MTAKKAPAKSAGIVVTADFSGTSGKFRRAKNIAATGLPDGVTIARIVLRDGLSQVRVAFHGDMPASVNMTLNGEHIVLSPTGRGFHVAELVGKTGYVTLRSIQQGAASNEPAAPPPPIPTIRVLADFPEDGPRGEMFGTLCENVEGLPIGAAMEHQNLEEDRDNGGGPILWVMMPPEAAWDTDTVVQVNGVWLIARRCSVSWTRRKVFYLAVLEDEVESIQERPATMPTDDAPVWNRKRARRAGLSRSRIYEIVELSSKRYSASHGLGQYRIYARYPADEVAFTDNDGRSWTRGELAERTRAYLDRVTAGIEALEEDIAEWTSA